MREPTEMELRVAKAAHNAFMADEWDSLREGGIERALWLQAIRSAIRAMREPTDDMRKAIGEGSDCGRFECFLNAYRDGVNAASPP